MRISQDSFSFQITETAEMSVRNKFKILFLCNFFYNVVTIELIMCSSTTSYVGVCFSIPVLNLHLTFKCWFLFLLCSWIFFEAFFFTFLPVFFFLLLLSLLVRFVCFSIIVFYFTRDVHQPLSQIRMSLSGSLGVGQIIFLAGINSTKNTVNGFSLLPSSKVGFVS